MKKIEAQCNSPEMAIRSQFSTDFLGHILKSIGSVEVDKTLKIFNKVKTLIAISDEEFDFMTNIIKSNEFKCAFYEKVEMLDIPPKKRAHFTFEALYGSFYTSLITARTIDILQKTPEGEGDISCDGESFRKIMQNDYKTIFLKVLEEVDRYYIAQDLRSRKNKFFSKESNHCIVETYAEIEFGGYIDKSRDILLLKGDDSSYYIVFGEKAVIVSSSVEYNESKYSFYVIDPVTSIIYQIDKETLKLTIRDFQNLNFIKINGRYILTFARPVLLELEKFDDTDDNRERKDYTPGILSLLDIQTGQDIFFHLHQKYNKTTKDGFLGCSYDMQYYFVLDFKTGNKKSFLIEDFVPPEVIQAGNTEIWNFIITINGAL